MTERPILFSGAMVRALLAGTKTQTRRVVKPRPGLLAMTDHRWTTDQILANIPCPYGAPGDRLWVRETWAPAPPIAPLLQHVGASPRPEPKALYRANPEQANLGVTWRPSIHMPRWASRLTLEVTGVRVERLCDISEADARAEGAQVVPFYPDDGFPLSDGWTHVGDDGKCVLYVSARESFEALWKAIYGADSWASNPWVWVIEFKRVTP